MLDNQRLKECRKKSGVSQEEVAKALNINVRTYKYYEAGGRQPSIEALVALADYFCVSIDYLIGRSDEPEYVRYVMREENKIFTDAPDDAYHFYCKNIAGKDLPQYRAVMERSKDAMKE